MADSKSSSFSVKDLEIETPKYPFAESPLLIDEFLIVGYPEFFKKEKIIKPLIDELSTKDYVEFYNIKEIKNRYLPSNLSTIKGDDRKTNFPFKQLLDFAFPIPPKIFYYIENNNKQVKEPNDINYLFSNTFDESVNIGYSYGFYQKHLSQISINLYFKYSYIRLK